MRKKKEKKINNNKKRDTWDGNLGTSAWAEGRRETENSSPTGLHVEGSKHSQSEEKPPKGIIELRKLDHLPGAVKDYF